MLIFYLTPQTPALHAIRVNKIHFDITSNQNTQATLGDYSNLSINKHNELYFIVTKGLTTSIESSDPQIIGYYMDCNTHQTAFYTLSQTVSEGISAMFWFRPKALRNAIQTIFALQGNANSQWDFAVEYVYSSNSIQLRQSSSFTLQTSQDTVISGKQCQLYYIFKFSSCILLSFFHYILESTHLELSL